MAVRATRSGSLSQTHEALQGSSSSSSITTTAARGSTHRRFPPPAVKQTTVSRVQQQSSELRAITGGQFNRRTRETYKICTWRMCGMDVDLDDGGSGEEEKEEEFWIGEGVKMLPPPVAHSGGSAWGSRRGRCGCMACGAGLILWNLCVILASTVLLAVVFSAVLLPAMLLLYVGFLCHSRVLDASSAICRYLDDNSCSALIILGFVLMSPLVVVAAAVFCGLLRRFRLLLLIQPITRAWYRGQLLDWTGGVHAWV